MRRPFARKRYVTPEGSRRWRLLTLTPKAFENGEIVRAFSTIRAI